MITAERFATTSGSYWAEIFPRLEHYLRISNLGPRVFDYPLELSSSPNRHAFVTECAFVIWKAKLLRVGDIELEEAQESARSRLRAVRRQVLLDGDLNSVERSEALALAGRLYEYSTRVKRFSDVQIDARLAGCGPIMYGTPDIIATDSSYGTPVSVIGEIKSVNRKFRSTDIRQVVTYLVLYFSMNQSILDVLLVINPLLGRSLEVEVDAFFQFASGRPSQEVIPELMHDWSVSGISL
jgi:hypothetical protein